MSQSFDASRSLTAVEQHSTIIAAIEINQSKWLLRQLFLACEFSLQRILITEMWHPSVEPSSNSSSRQTESSIFVYCLRRP